MCVRVLTDSGTELVAAEPEVQQKLQQNDRLKRVKEKYVKLYERMVQSEELRVGDAEVAAIPPGPMTEVAANILTDSTQSYKLLLRRLADYYEEWHGSKMFKILFSTTQPAHVITMIAVLWVTSALMPASDKMHAASHSQSKLTSFIYLTSFVVHFGAQIWMTFVSGLSLYFALPRHTFSEVQRVLFPRYFTLNACLSLTTLLIFLKHHPTNTWNTEITVQVVGMFVAFFLELLIRLYLTPELLRLIGIKITMERAAGVGKEVGHLNPGSLKHCPYFTGINGAFRRVHATIAAGNILSMSCTILHLYYLTNKLCVL